MEPRDVLDATSLSEQERRVVVRFTNALKEELGEELGAVWLYGSRARGERAHPDSDVDLLVLTRDPVSYTRQKELQGLLYDAADAEGASFAFFSAHFHDLGWLAERRQIESFYIAEVDRDKIVLAGER